MVCGGLGGGVRRDERSGHWQHYAVCTLHNCSLHTTAVVHSCAQVDAMLSVAASLISWNKGGLSGARGGGGKLALAQERPALRYIW
jgi:hypothetical protein